MAVPVGHSLEAGIRRTLSRNGVVLILVWAVVSSLSLLAYNSWMASLFSALPSQPAMLGPTLNASPLAAGLATLGLYLLSFVVLTGALRTFVTDERRALPTGNFTRNLGRVLLNLVVGYALFSIAVWIGFVLLILPGVFLTVSLFFWFVIVIVEDSNFYEAFRKSWGLAKGNRWSLFGIGLIVTVVGWLLMAIPMVASFVLSPWIAWVMLGIAVSVYGVFSIATAARVYVHLTTVESTTPT